MADKIYKNIDSILEKEYKDLSDEAIDKFGKGERLDPKKQKRYDEVKDQISAQVKNPKKPLHVRSLENQVSYNPFYRKVVDSLGKLDDDVDDAYFYGLKDAYEKHNYEPSNDQIRDELVDQYWRLSDSYRDRYGYNDHDWDWYGAPAFEKKYGTEDAFVRKLLNAYINNLEGR